MANNRLNTTITIGGAITAGLRSAIGSTVDGLRRVGRTIADVQRQQNDVGKAIEANRRTGQSVTELEKRYAQLGKTLGGLKSAQALMAGNEAATQANLASRADKRGKIGEVVALAAASIGPIMAAAKFEKAMLGVAKQVEGSRNAAGELTQVYFNMAKQVQILARKTPLATNEIAEMVAAGARMGVAKDELIQFTRTAAMMSSAFELPAGELADDMGKIAGLFKIPIPAIGDLADTINYLDDNAISKGGDIIKFLTATGGAAGSVKITGQQMAALGSTLLTLGEEAGSAGTATNAMFTKLAAADKGTKKFQEAIKEIRLTTKEVQTGMQQDAQGTILKVMDAIAKLPKEKQLGVLVDLIGLEHSDTLAKMANNTAEYRKQILLASSAESKGSMSREFEAQRATTLAQWQMAKNRLGEMAVVIGSALLPAVNRFFAAVGPVVSKIADWMRVHPKLTQGIFGTATAVSALAVVTWGAGYAFTFLRSGMLAITGAYARVAGVVAMYRAGTLAATMNTTVLGRAAVYLGNQLVRLGTYVIRPLLSIVRPLVMAFMVAGAPIWAVVAAVAGLAAVGLTVRKYWEPLKAFFSGFFEGLVAGMAPMHEAISKAFEPVATIIKPIVMPILETVGRWFREAVTWVGNFLEPIDKASSTTVAFGKAGKTCGEVVGQAFSMMLKPILLVLEAIKWIHDNVGGVIDKVAKVGSAISGGVRAAKDYVTGGPDTPAVPAMRGAGGGADGAAASQTNTYNITQLPGESAEQLARRIAEINKRDAAVRGRSRMTDGGGD